MRRRDFIALLGAALTAPASVSPARAAEAGAAKIDWQRYKGTTVNLFMSRHPWQEAIEPMLPEFEALTGIKVQANKLPEQQYLTKVVTALSANAFPQVLIGTFMCLVVAAVFEIFFAIVQRLTIPRGIRV